MRSFYYKHSRQLQLSFTNPAWFVVGILRVNLQHTCLSMVGMLVGLAPVFPLFFQSELPHKETECHYLCLLAHSNQPTPQA